LSVESIRLYATPIMSEATTKIFNSRESAERRADNVSVMNRIPL
jgi:hypothetical protein